MSTFLKGVLYLVGICFILSILPTYYFHIDGINHWVNLGGLAENVIGFGIIVIIFAALAIVFFSVLAGIFVVVAMIVGALVLAGLSAIWPFLLLGVIIYLLFSKSNNVEK